MTPQTQKMTFKSKLQALFILALFILPLLGAIFMYAHRENFHFDTTNHGNLINAPIPIGHIQALADQKKWLLVYISPSNCDAACEKHIYYVNQVHTALGKKMPAMIPTVVMRDNAISSTRYPKLRFISLGPSELLWLNEQLPLSYQISEQGIFFLIDPQGNLMMHYHADILPKSLLKDLQHLIRI